MRLWFATSSEVPIYRQMVTQVILAIVSGELRPGDRLPSTRDLARRFGLHPNTISAGYRQLEREGWTELRRGSGVYVRSAPRTPQTPEQILDKHIAAFFRAVRELNLTAATVRTRVAHWLAAPEPDHFLLIDPDPAVRNILVTELAALTALPVQAASPDALTREILTAAIPLCRPTQTKLVRAALPIGIELTTLPIRSANQWLSARQIPPPNMLIAVVSHWPEFLTRAHTMLIAVGLPAEALIFRDASKSNWTRGLDKAGGILTDAHTALNPKLPAKIPRLVFPILAPEAAAELVRLAPTLTPANTAKHP